MKKFVIFMLTLVLGISCAFALCSCGEKKLIGFDTELAEAVGEVLGVDVKFQEINWDTKETLLETGSIDVVWNGFTYSTERDNGYYDNERDAQIGGLDFTNFYMQNKQVAVVKKANASSYTSNDSFSGKKGCAEASSAGEGVIVDILNASAAQLEKQLDCFTGVQAGTYDYAVIDASMASEYVVSEKGAYHDSLAVVDIAGVDNEYYAVAVKEGSNLKSVLDWALAKVFASGKANSIAEKYSLSGVLYNGFTTVDVEGYTLPTDGAWKAISNKGELIIGYTIFAPMNYFEA